MQKSLIHDRIKKYALMGVDQVYRDLQLTPNGLSDSECAEARQKYGYNNLTSKNKDSILHCVRRAFVNPFSIILFFLGIISFVTDFLLRGDYQKKWTSVVIIFLMLLVSGTVRLTQELRTKKIADNLINLVNTSVTVLRNGSWIKLPAHLIVVGDQVRISAGERVPADIRLTFSNDLYVSQSVITGESGLVEKTCRILKGNKDNLQISDYSNILFGGTTIAGGNGAGIVVAVGSDSVYGGFDIAAEERKHGFDKGANSIAWVLIRFMAVLVPVVFIASGITQDNWLAAFIFSLSVAVGLTPELLPMVVNACLARGSYQMGQKQTIVKNINAMQSFGSMDVLCVDKTGTLTGDKVILEYYMDILGNESTKTLDYGYLASYYHTGIGNHLDTAIMSVSGMPGKKEYYEKLVNAHQKINERPFDSGKKYSGVILNNGDQKINIIKGSVDEIIKKCSFIEYCGNVSKIGYDPSKNVHEIVDEMLEDGMKVIAVAYKNIMSTKDTGIDKETNDYILLGYLAFFDAPKKSAASAIKKLQDQSVNIRVLTGDQSLVAMSICQRLGIPKENTITGPELNQISDNDLPVVIERTNVFTELTPKQKALIVETLQANGHTVGFLGDGMNDLPAVIQADVGISVENATNSVKESADVILLKKDLNVLEEGIIEGRKAFSNMSKYIKITASSNFGNICAVVIASVLLPFFPMTSIQLLLLNLLYDLLCLVLPWDKVDSEMLISPLEWSGKGLGKFMGFFGPLSSVFDLVTYAFLFFVLCPKFAGGAFSSLSITGQQYFISLFQTGWFLESMWTQILILQLLRTTKLPFIQSKPGLPVIVVTVIGIIMFTLLPITPFGELLGLCKLPAMYYLFLVSVVILYLLLVTCMKSLYVKKTKSLI